MTDILKFDFQFFTIYFVTGRPFSKAHILSCTTKNMRENWHLDSGLTWYWWVNKPKRSYKYTVVQRELQNLSTTVSITDHRYILIIVTNKYDSSWLMHYRPQLT